jgi:hypothetical protein
MPDWREKDGNAANHQELPRIAVNDWGNRTLRE